MATDKIMEILVAIAADPKAQELLESTPKPEDQEAEIRVYADIAAKLGYDITEEELKAYLEKAAGLMAGRTEESAAAIKELPDDVLDKVAGGKKDNDKCKDTYRDYENCWVNDGCDNVYHDYPHYLCHLAFWDNPCHAKETFGE